MIIIKMIKTEVMIIMMIPGEGVNRDQAVCEQLSGGQKEVLEREITEGNNVFFLLHVLYNILHHILYRHVYCYKAYW